MDGPQSNATDLANAIDEVLAETSIPDKLRALRDADFPAFIAVCRKHGRLGAPAEGLSTRPVLDLTHRATE